eukprot:CCRYP_016572-RA/>CCRYP_016572-RA protein AED:0.34 eAED:0.34 QI:0/0/0/0.66/0/0/3/0/71
MARESMSGRGAARRATAGRGAGATRAGGGSSTSFNFIQMIVLVTPTTVLVASLSFVGLVVLLHIWGKFRGA